MTAIAQIGCGHWGKNLARNFSQAGALAAIVDPDPATAARISQQLNDVPVRTFDDVLQDPSIDGVALATPAQTHVDLGLQAIAAGKHVYVEKPIALNIEDAETLIKAAEGANRQLMVGHLLQYHPVFQRFKALVEEGLIGDLKYVYSNRLSLGKFRVEEDVMWSFAAHDISMLLSLAGEPKDVGYSGAGFVTEGLDDWALLSLQFEDGVRGHVQTSWAHPFKEQRLVAVGSEGMLVFEDSAAEWEKKLIHYAHKIDMSGREPVPEKADPVYLEVERSEPLRAECDAFVRAIETGVPAPTNGAEGLAVLRVLTAATLKQKAMT